MKLGLGSRSKRVIKNKLLLNTNKMCICYIIVKIIFDFGPLPICLALKSMLTR